MSEQMRQFWGKFPAQVTATDDPQSRGRIKARVQDIYGDEDSGWAQPCVPYAGNGVGLFLVPPVGANVWIEFEQGDPNRPIWSGCYWAEGETPASPAEDPIKMLKTAGATFTLDDNESSITIETGDGMKITLNNSGIEIDAGQGEIKVNGLKISLNDGALEVQ